MRFFATTCLFSLCATHAGAASIHDGLINFQTARSGLGDVSEVLLESFDGEVDDKLVHTFDSGLTMIAAAQTNGSSDQSDSRAPRWSTLAGDITLYIFNASLVSFNFRQPVNAVYFDGFSFFDDNDSVSLTGTVIEETDGRRRTEEVFGFRYGPGSFWRPGDGWETWNFGIVSDKAFEQVNFMFQPRDNLGIGFFDITAWTVKDEAVIPPVIEIPTSPVPLPAPALLLLSAVVSLGLWGRRKPPAALPSVA